MSNDGCRFCKLYAIALVGVACFLGALQLMQVGVGLAKLGGAELVVPIVLLSSVISYAPAASGSALLLALLLWSHGLTPSVLALELPSKLKRGMLLSLAGYWLALLMVLIMVTALAAGIFGVAFATIRSGLRVVGPADWAIGYAHALVDALVVSFVAWRGLPALHASKLSLPAKIAVALPVLFVIRSVVGLAFPGGRAN